MSWNKNLYTMVEDFEFPSEFLIAKWFLFFIYVSFQIYSALFWKTNLTLSNLT